MKSPDFSDNPPLAKVGKKPTRQRRNRPGSSKRWHRRSLPCRFFTIFGSCGSSGGWSSSSHSTPASLIGCNGRGTAQVAGSFSRSIALFDPSDRDPAVAHGTGHARFWTRHLLGPSAHAAHIPLLRPLFLFWRSVFRLRRPRRPSREMVVADASLGAVHRLPVRARIFNRCIRISPRDPRPGHGPGPRQWQWRCRRSTLG